MASQISMELIGELGLTTVNVNPETLASVIQLFLTDVSKIHSVDKADLQIRKDPNNIVPDTVAEAIRYGTKFFDAVYYFTLDDKEGVAMLPHYSTDVSLKQLVTKEQDWIIRACNNLLVCYLHIMMRGAYPSNPKANEIQKVPAFFKSILGFDSPLGNVANELASFDLNKIDMSWVKLIKTGSFNIAIKNRLSLGIPGYRMLMPFKLYPLKSGVSQEVKAAYEWVQKLVNRGFYWDIFPPTRSSQVTQKLGPMNAALGNLMLECFTQDQLKEMAEQSLKIIFDVPKKDQRANHWRSWSAITDLELQEPMDFNST